MSSYISFGIAAQSWRALYKSVRGDRVVHSNYMQLCQFLVSSLFLLAEIMPVDVLFDTCDSCSLSHSHS